MYQKIGTALCPCCFVKDTTRTLYRPMPALLNSSCEMGIFPNAWQIARVTLVFKSCSKSDMGHYKPMSVLSVFSTLLEKFVHDHVSTCLHVHMKLSECQSASLKMHSILTSLLNVTDA